LACRIGTEHEKLAFRLEDNSRADYNDIKHVLDRLVSRFGWKPIMEGDSIIGCKMDGQSVTLEPGGQFELSGAPLTNLHQTCDEVNRHLYQAKAISEEVGVGFLGLGFDPKSSIPEVPMMPKNRYKIMRNYMPKVGTMGLDMMFRSCTIQVRSSPYILR
jgi:glutamate--cysteine ligase